MVISSILLGLLSVFVFSGLCLWIFKNTTLQVQEQGETFLLDCGKLKKKFIKPGLYWVPEKLFPWVRSINISKKIDCRTYKGIQVHDKFGTTVMVDLWVEFKIMDPYRALFSVENWEEVLHSVVIHTTASILCSQTIDEILRHRSELAEQLKENIRMEMERWGLTLSGAMIQNIGLLPEVSKQFFHSVGARIERITALVKEEGRLEVARLEATTAHRVAELNALGRSQLPLEIAKFYDSLNSDPALLKKFQEYWQMTNLDPRKTVTFSGFSENSLGIVETAKAFESIVQH